MKINNIKTKHKKVAWKGGGKQIRGNLSLWFTGSTSLSIVSPLYPCHYSVPMCLHSLQNPMIHSTTMIGPYGLDKYNESFLPLTRDIDDGFVTIVVDSKNCPNSEIPTEKVGFPPLHKSRCAFRSIPDFQPRVVPLETIYPLLNFPNPKNDNFRFKD